MNDSPSTRRRAIVALVATVALYGAYGGLRVAIPSAAGVLGFLLIAGFYFLPGILLRREPQVATRWQVGPESPVPRLDRGGIRLALFAVAIVFPVFSLGFLGFYAYVCAGDLSTLAPALWIEQWTPWEGRLAHFMARLCQTHEGGWWPQELRLPAEWTRAWGLGFLLQVTIGVFAIALPEEVFHRGYLMSALEEHWPARRRLFGVPFGVAALASSALFALGHLVAMAETARLGTFFPALVFAWLWRKSGSLWAPALFHAGSNLLMELLLASSFPSE